MNDTGINYYSHQDGWRPVASNENSLDIRHHPDSASHHASSRLWRFFAKANVETKSVRRVAAVALAVAGPGGMITEKELQRLTGYACSTVRLACRRLVGLKVFSPIPKPLGRGYLKTYVVIWGQSSKNHRSDKRNLEKSPDKDYKDYKKLEHSKDRIPGARSRGVAQSLRVRKVAQSSRKNATSKRESSFYQNADAAKVTLLQGARFYRSVMRAIRLGLESWAIPKAICEALEGFFGLRIDGASLAYARELRDKIWALRREIEALAASRATPRRVCSFVAGRLAGVPEKRSKREVLKRTAELIHSLERLERRIAGLRVWLVEREQEYRAGLVCARCGYRHTTIEYHSGYRDDGTGRLNCFGFARIKLEELTEQRKLAERTRRAEACRMCGSPLRDGHVDGVCWSCWDRDLPGQAGPLRPRPGEYRHGASHKAQGDQMTTIRTRSKNCNSRFFVTVL